MVCMAIVDRNGVELLARYRTVALVRSSAMTALLARKWFG